MLLKHPRVAAATLEAFVLPPNPPVRLLNQPGPSAALLNHAIAAMVALPEKARRAALRRVLAPGFPSAGSQAPVTPDVVLAAPMPMFHPARTRAMAAVVDPQGRVFGVQNLRAGG